MKHSFWRINITEEILDPYKSNLKPSELAAFIVVYRHYRKIYSDRNIFIDIPGEAGSMDEKINYIKKLAREIEERVI